MGRTASNSFFPSFMSFNSSLGSNFLLFGPGTNWSVTGGLFSLLSASTRPILGVISLSGMLTTGLSGSFFGCGLSGAKGGLGGVLIFSGFEAGLIEFFDCLTFSSFGGSVDWFFFFLLARFCLEQQQPSSLEDSESLLQEHLGLQG